MFFSFFIPVGYKIVSIKCNFKNVKFILASKENMIHSISPFSIYNPPSVQKIQPADIPAASPEPVTPVSHHMAQELLYDRWGRMVHRYADCQVVSIMGCSILDCHIYLRMGKQSQLPSALNCRVSCITLMAI